MKEKILNFLSLILVIAAAAAGASAQMDSARGIDKKDIRVIIVYPGNLNPAEAEKVKSDLNPLIDAISKGAKLTKADAARTSGPANNSGKGGSPIEEVFGPKLMEWARTSTPGEMASVLLVTSGPGINARPNCNDYKCPVDCSVNHCSSRGAGWETLGCCNYCNDKAFCCGYSCIKHVGHTAADHRTVAPKPGSSEPIKLIVILAKPGITNEQIANLEKFGVESFANEPFPAGITIKTKSSNAVRQDFDTRMN